MTNRKYGVIEARPQRLYKSINAAGQLPKYEKLEEDPNAPSDYQAREEFWRALREWAMFEWAEILGHTGTFAGQQAHKYAQQVRRGAVYGYDVVIDPRTPGEPHEHYRQLGRGLFVESYLRRGYDPRTPKYFNAGPEYFAEMERRGLKIAPPIEGE